MSEENRAEKEKLKQSLGLTEEEIEIFLKACEEATNSSVTEL